MTKQLLFSGMLGVASMLYVAPMTSFAQITPEQVAQLQQIGGSYIAQNGNFIIYTLSTPVDPTKDNAANKLSLHIYNIAKKTSTPLFDKNSISQVAFRPTTGTLTFVSKEKEDKVNSVYELDINTGVAKKIFTHATSIINYAWSNDGKKLAFITSEKNNVPKTNLTYSPRFFEEDLAEKAAYIVNDLSAKAEKLNLNNGSAYIINWSPLGDKVAVSVAPTSSVDDSYMAQKIKIVDATTKNIIANIDNEGKLGQFVWSPDGSKLALVNAFDLHDPTNGSLLIVNTTGGKPTVIDGDYQGKYESIDWKQKDMIYFLSSEGTTSNIGKISVDGRKKTYITKATDRHITSFSVSDKNLISFTASTPTHPNELFLIDTKKSTPVKLTNSNEWLKDIKLGRQEVVKYKARDGKFDIEGMLIYPIDYKQGDQYPLITVVHGGPESHYNNGWLTNYSMPGQMAAGKGYAVFYPNYRGSTGRGVTFTYSSQSDLAGKEFDDIVDGVDYLIDKGLADKARVGVTGGSYGGYASAWMSTYYSDRFAAAVMFVGISNNISKFGTSDIPSEMALVHERGYIWENWKKQLEVSPIYYVDRSQTPILIMHGAEDPRVHPAQSMELYRHIKVRKPEVPVRLIYYPGEGHGNTRSGSKYDYNLRMLQWFDTYLKTGDRKAAMPSLDLPVNNK